MALADDIQSRANALLAKISDAEPSGPDAKYDERHEAIRAAIADLDSPTGGEVDWKQVTKQCHELLATTSKDLLIASYYAFALLKHEGTTGLAVGLANIDGLFDQHWDTLWPAAKRMRGRGNALGWLVDRLTQTLPSVNLNPSDRPAIDIIDGQWKSIGSKAREKMGDHVPPMSGVADALTRIKLKLPEAPAAAPEPPAPAAPAPAPAAAAPPPAAGGAPAPEPPAPAAPPAPVAPAAAPSEPGPAAAAEPAKPAEPAEPADPLDAIREEAKAWLEPISADAPAGEDARYDEAYEACRAQIAMLEAPTGGEPDWKAVATGAGELLKTKAKDVLMASYFAYGRYKQRGLEHLPLGLVVLDGLVEQFHETMFPTRARGRGNAASWLLTILEAALGQEKLTPKDRPTVLALDKAYKSLAGTLRERLGDNAPSTTPMSQRIQRMLLAVPEQKAAPPKPPPPPKPTPAAAPAQAPAAAAPARAPSAPMPAAAADVSNADEVNKFLLDTGRSLSKAAGVLRRAELSTPAAYRLMRAGLWMHLHKAPPSDAGGKTQIPPLPAARRKQFETILANAKWAAAIEETESALQQFRFCLDLNRMTDHALEQLGDTHAGARAALAGEVSALLRRMPELPELTAGDGTPLADDETKAWLATLAPSDGDGGGGGGSADAEDKAAMADVRGSIAAKPMDAMKVAREKIAEAGTPRSRFLRQLILAEICLGANQPKLARGMFAALEREIDARSLLEWEPDLSARCLEGLVKSIRAANKAGGKFTGADTVFERLCLVDPAAAARLAG